VEPLTRGLTPTDPILSALCLQVNLLNLPPPKKIPGLNTPLPLKKFLGTPLSLGLGFKMPIVLRIHNDVHHPLLVYVHIILKLENCIAV
jgi:hypothetical protein